MQRHKGDSMQMRKLVKSGLSSFVVALPKEFIDQNKLGKGDSVYIEHTSKNELTIATEYNEGRIEKREIVITVDKKPFETIKRELTAAYLDNYHEIILKGKDLPKYMKSIKEEVNEKVALEVVDESSERLVIKDFLNYKDIDATKLIRRIDNIVRSMLIDMKEAFGNKDVSIMIYERDKEVNKLSFLVYRIVKTASRNPEVAKMLNISTMDIVAIWDINLHLEKMGDECKRIARLIVELDTKSVNKKRMLEIISLMEEQYKKAMEAFHTKNAQLADEVHFHRKEIFKELDTLLEKAKDMNLIEIVGKFKGMMSHLTDISRLIRYT